MAAMAVPRLVDGPGYGAIELAMTVGLLASSVLGLGIPAAATRLHLIDKDPRGVSLLATHALWMAVIGATSAFCLMELGYDAGRVCCAAILGCYGLQFSSSAYTRMRGHIYLSGWFDNVTVLLIFLLLAPLSGNDERKLEGLSHLLIILSVLIAGGAVAVLLASPRPGFSGLMRQALSVGLPSVLFGVSSLLIFGTVRISIDHALTLSDVACFSLCARITLLLVFLKQILETGFFRRLYQIENAALSGIFSIWIVALSGAATILALVGHFTTDLLVLGTDIPAARVKVLFPLVTVQTMLWTLNSSLDMFIIRDLLSRRAAAAFTCTALVGLVVGAVAHSYGLLDLATIVNVYNLAMLAALLIQMKLLSRRGHSFGRAYPALLFVFAPLLVYLLP